MFRRTVAIGVLGIVCFLGGCVLADDFADSPETTAIDLEVLLEDQLPTRWATLVTNQVAPDAGYVLVLEFRQGGSQTLDVGVDRFAGEWEITDGDEIALTYSSEQGRGDLVADPIVINGELVSLTVPLDLNEDGEPRMLTFQPVDRARVGAAELYGDWRTSPIEDDGRLGTEFDATSYYGGYSALGSKHFIKGALMTFPCKSTQTCWAMVESRFAEGMKSEEGADISGDRTLNVGGTIHFEADVPSSIYLPILNDQGVTRQVLARPRAL